jgi:hypothetical protein
MAWSARNTTGYCRTLPLPPDQQLRMYMCMNMHTHIPMQCDSRHMHYSAAMQKNDKCIKKCPAMYANTHSKYRSVHTNVMDRFMNGA